MSFLQFFVHANLDSLYEHVPKRCLPQEYGGEGGQLDRLTGMSDICHVSEMEMN